MADNENEKPGEKLAPFERGCHFNCDLRRVLMAWDGQTTTGEVINGLAMISAITICTTVAPANRMVAVETFLDVFQETFNALHLSTLSEEITAGEPTRTQDTEGFKAELLKAFIHKPGHS